MCIFLTVFNRFLFFGGIIKDTVTKRSASYTNLDAEVENRIHASNMPLTPIVEGRLPVFDIAIIDEKENIKDIIKESNPTVTFNEEAFKEIEKPTDSD